MLKENVCLKMLFAVLCYVFVNTIFQPWIIEKFTLEGLIDIIFISFIFLLLLRREVEWLMIKVEVLWGKNSEVVFCNSLL